MIQMRLNKKLAFNQIPVAAIFEKKMECQHSPTVSWL